MYGTQNTLFKRAALNFYQIAELRFLGFEFGVLAKFIPERIRERYGLVLIKEIDIVIDASGFKYSDQWGKDICIELADSVSGGRIMELR